MNFLISKKSEFCVMLQLYLSASCIHVAMTFNVVYPVQP